MPQHSRLELEFLVRRNDVRSGVFLRFTHPDNSGSDNLAWWAVDRGFAVQSDNTGAAPAGQLQGLPNPTPGVPPATPGGFVNPWEAIVNGWNRHRIEMNGDVFTVNLNGQDTARYTNPDPNRGRCSLNEPIDVGPQSSSNCSFTAAFRNIRVMVLEDASPALAADDERARLEAVRWQPASVSPPGSGKRRAPV